MNRRRVVNLMRVRGNDTIRGIKSWTKATALNLARDWDLQPLNSKFYIVVIFLNCHPKP